MSRLKRPRPRRRLRRLLSLLSARTAWTDAQESAGYTAPTNLSCNPNANARGVRRQHVYSLRRQRRPSRHSTKETALPNGDSRRACSARVFHPSATVVCGEVGALACCREKRSVAFSFLCNPCFVASFFIFTVQPYMARTQQIVSGARPRVDQQFSAYGKIK